MSQSFETLYWRLTDAARHYHSVARTPDHLGALADAHWELHLARRAIAEERTRLEHAGAIYTSDDRRWLDRVGIDG